MIKLELTREQMDQLAPLFDRVREANREGQTVAIGAQVWRDGMVVRFFKEDQARALSAALGGDFDRIHYSAEERMEAATSGVKGRDHVLYTDADKDRPDVICDGNGQVVLGLCKVCGKAEAELLDSPECPGNAGVQACPRCGARSQCDAENLCHGEDCPLPDTGDDFAAALRLASGVKGRDHVLYTDADKDRPDVICDGNGQVVLGLCKVCGKAEAELLDSPECPGNAGVKGPDHG